MDGGKISLAFVDVFLGCQLFPLPNILLLFTALFPVLWCPAGIETAAPEHETQGLRAIKCLVGVPNPWAALTPKGLDHLGLDLSLARAPIPTNHRLLPLSGSLVLVMFLIIRKRI